MKRTPFLVAALAVALASSARCDRGGGAGADGHRRPGANLVLFSIDTCRADHLSLHGYPRATSPALARFAERAIVFDSAIAAAPVTAPSHMSLFTGLPPTVHGVRNYEDGEAGAPPRLPRTLPDGIVTLAEILREKGYRTGAFTGGGNVNKELGFGRGFETYLQGFESGTNGNGVRDFDPSLALEWVERAAKGKSPFFLFLHTYIPHSPYLPPPPHARRWNPGYAGKIPCDRAAFFESAPKRASFASINDLFWNAVDTKDERDVAQLVALYDGEINASDDAVASVLESVERLGLEGKTVVVVTSDHGELFGEHGEFRHPGELWDGLLRVPLVVAVPGLSAGRRVSRVVSALDVLPTILDVLALPRHPQPLGRSLLEVAADAPAGRVAVSEHVVAESAGKDEGPWAPSEFVRSLRDDRMKLIRRVRDGVAIDELYDVVADEGETTNVAGDPARAATLESLRALSAQYDALGRSLRRTAATAAISEETMEELRALGYLK